MKKKQRHSKRNMLLMSGLLGVLMSACAMALDEHATADPPWSEDNLRGIFFYQGKTDASPLVGKLSIRLLVPGMERTVRLNHAFKSQQAFRFEVASNHDGWISVYHQSPNAKLHLLWPNFEEFPQIAANAHQVVAEKPIQVPPSPDKFIFDDNTGDEQFYVVIHAQQQSPLLDAIEVLTHTSAPRSKKTNPANKPTAKPPQTAVAQQDPQENAAPPENADELVFQMRLRNMGTVLSRTTKFVPGHADQDPNVYFSTESKNINGMAIFTFHLQHEN